MKNTLQEIAVAKAPKQAGLVNTLVEENPILATIPTKASSHSLWNVYAKLTDIRSMKPVDFDSELPKIGVSSELGKSYLYKIGGVIQAPQDKVIELGGFDAFFNEQIPHIIKKSGNDHEKMIYYNQFLSYALANNNAINGNGTTANKQYSMVAVHYDNSDTIGLYSALNPSNGKMFNQILLNNGALYNMTMTRNDGTKYEVIGKELAIYLVFGLQLANPKHVQAIVNIEPTASVSDRDKISGLPTAMMIDDMLDKAEAQGTNTIVYAHPSLISKLAIKFNLEKRYANNETDSVKYAMVQWNGIPFVGSYNLSRGGEPVQSL